MTKKYGSLVPDKYMDGWDGVYKKQIDGDLNELPHLYIHYALQEFMLFTHDINHEGKKALELGTGDGRYACLLAQLGFEVDAIDVLPSAIEITEKRAKALGMTILAYDPYVRNASKELEIKFVDLETIFKEGDFVTIHSRLTDKTKGMISKHLIEFMKKDAYFVNTSRG